MRKKRNFEEQAVGVFFEGKERAGKAMCDRIAENCGGCARFFEQDPLGIKAITRYDDTVSHEYRCQWLIPINKIYRCPCVQCLIKSLCWDQCERVTKFMQVDPIVFLDNTPQ